MTRGFNFNSIPAPKLKRSAFDLSHEFKFSAPMGKLIPVLTFEGLPGDTFKINVSQLARFLALESPMMQRVDVKFEFFKVPNRLIYKDWENFITGGVDGTEKPQVPVVDLYSSMLEYPDAFMSGSLAHYLGLPMPYRLTAQGTWVKIPTDELVNTGVKVSALPFNAYHKIYNDYYRDQNIIEESGLADESQEYSADLLPNGEDFLSLHNRAWKKDYFTSALNDPQRGQAVAVGLAGDAPISGKATWSTDNPAELADDDAAAGSFGAFGNVMIGSDTTGRISGEDGTSLSLHPNTDLQLPLDGTADLSEASALSIIALRTAFKLQQFLERNNIAGSRYVESMLAHFGVKSSDARLQRAEFLGRFSFPVHVSPVDSTADAGGATVGEQAGKAVSAGGSKTIRTFCEEHCIIMGLMSIMPQASYSQGVPRMFSRQDKFDYFWPEFQNIGEQEIKNKELYLDYSGEGDPESAFGYQSRYVEYKYMPDRVAGDLATNLSYWHMGRLFEQQPGLNKQFIECDPTDRVFAVQDGVSDQHVICDLWFNIRALRPMARYSTPHIS